MKPVILQMALRNLVRHLRRTLITVAVIALGLVSLLFLWAFSDGLHANMLGNFQDTIIGSIQVHRRGFFQQPELSRHIPDAKRVTAELQNMGITRWTHRLETFALAASPETTEGVMLIGMHPERERKVTRLPDKVSLGRFFTPGDEYVCVLGAITAGNLGLQLGDPLVMVGYDRFGVLVAEEFTLVGIISGGGMGIDRGMALVPLAALQEMLDMEGLVTDIPLRVEESALERVTRDLRLALADEDLEVMRWYDMFPVMREWVSLNNGFLYLFLMVVMLIVLAGVLNTLLLSMLERTREFGVFMALGTRVQDIRLMVMAESLFVGVAGVIVGTVLGVVLVQLLQVTGIDLSQLLGSTERFFVNPRIEPRLDLTHLVATVLSILGASLVAGLYPAWKAGRLQPVEAIRHV